MDSRWVLASHQTLLDTGFLSVVMSVLIVCSGPSYWNSILLAMTTFEVWAWEYYPDRWDLRFSLRFEAKIFISGWKNVSTCRIKSLFFCLGINHKSLFLWTSFFQLFPNITVDDLPEVFVMSEYVAKLVFYLITSWGVRIENISLRQSYRQRPEEEDRWFIVRRCAVVSVYWVSWMI